MSGHEQVAAYQAFGDALEAAGQAGSEDEVRARLRDGARAGLKVFETSGTLESTIADLETGEEETFVDTSAANPWTYVRALYAALAAGDEATLEGLAAMDPENLRSEQVVVAPALEEVAGALRARLRGEDVPAPDGRAEDEGDRYWRAQLAVIAGDEDALAAVEAAERDYFGAGSAEAALQLPARGLRALAARR